MIRPAVIADLDQLEPLEQTFPIADRFSRRRLAYLVGKANSTTLVVATGTGELAGAAFLLFRRGSTVAHLYSIAVGSAHRGQGHARRLLQAAERAARKRKCRVIRLEVRQRNAPARRLYVSKGYSCRDEIPGYYPDGATAIRYEKSL